MSQSGVYGEDKMVWWYAREQKLPDTPKQVQMVISDLCNQDCHFCAYRQSGYTSNELFVGDSELSTIGHNNPHRFMPNDRAITLLDEIKRAGVLSVQFTGGGEPTAHPDHEKFFIHALDLGLRCSLVSNGVRWGGLLTHEILPRFDWVRVSIDASDQESYTKTRRCSKRHWSRVWANIRDLEEGLKEKKSHTTLGLGFVVTPESYKDILKFAEMAKYSGAHNVRFTAMFSKKEELPFLDIYDEIVTLIQRAKLLASEDFQVYDNFGSRFADLKQHSPDYKTCSYQHYTTYIGGDLRAYRCCVYAYNMRGLIDGGNLEDNKFDEFWNSKERKDDMAAFDATGCERCQFNQKNRSLLYVMGNTASDTKSRHLEWP
jgi:MoaA/NifB/PqqE/SkfB family radical SAM enzyme